MGGAQVLSRPREAALIATLTLDEAGGLARVAFRGPLTREAARTALLGLHGSDATTLATALRDAGARYGPDEQDALEAALPLAALARPLGAVRLGRLAFDQEAAPLQWSVELVGDAGVSYQVTVEPFAGRITSIVRLGGTP